MNHKTSVYFFFFMFLAFLLLASCKNSGEVNLDEKRECFKDCMLVEEDKAYCLDDCNVEETDIEQKPKEICGDNICQQAEQQGNLCSRDCNTCTANTDCGEKEICKDSACKPVDCTEESHCPQGYVCTENACVKEELDTTAVEDLQTEIGALSDDIDVLVRDIIALQTAIDAADASADDKEIVQEDIDALQTVMSQLKAYNGTILGYANDLEDVKKNADIAEIGTTFNAAKTEIESYIEEQTTEVEAIAEAINDLEPAASPDLIVEDLDFESIDGNDVTFTVTFTNDDEGNITANDSFRVKLTSYEEDNSTEVDDVKATFSDGLEPDEEGEVEVELEIEYNLENYFNTNTAAQKYIVLFLVELDVDDAINESDEDNNKEYFNVTFDREDYVTNTAPVANIAVTPSNASVSVNETVTFSGAGSTDSDGSVSSYSWDFGDSYSSTSSAPTHSYTTAGSYTVTLTVTDNDGATDSETTTITVS